MLLAIYLTAALLILCQGLFYIINHMGRHTPHLARLAWLLLTTGALDVAIGPVFGRMCAPTYGDAVLMAALAGYLLWRGRVQTISEGLSND